MDLISGLGFGLHLQHPEVNLLPLRDVGFYQFVSLLTQTQVLTRPGSDPGAN